MKFKKRPEFDWRNIDLVIRSNNEIFEKILGCVL